MDIRAATEAKRLSEWAEMVRACKNSGMTVNDWCRENGLQPKTYYYRQNKVFAVLPELSKRARSSEASQVIGFVEVPKVVATERPGAITIQLHGAQIIIEDGVDTTLLEKVLSAVSRIC